MRAENQRMKKWLKANGINALPKYLWNGSMRGCWRLYQKNVDWTEDMWVKLTSLGFVDFDGGPLDRFSGNGGRFSVFPRLTDKYASQQILYGTDDVSAIY